MSAIKRFAALLMSCVCFAAHSQSATEQPSTPLTLNADADGHFCGQLLINGHAMPFMIDSGATYTSIPMKMAVAAGLPLGEQVETHTANGRGFAKATRIANLRLGNNELKNLQAHANPHLQQVLVGLNALKYFIIQQTADSMTLSINPQMLQPEKLDAGVSVSAGMESASPAVAKSTKPPRPIVKSQVCKPGQNCIIRYGN